MSQVAPLCSRAVGKYGAVVLGHGKPIFEVQEPFQTCTSCFYTSRTLFPQPEFCYDMSMVSARALMSCDLLESSERGSSRRFFSSGHMHGSVVGKTASDRADKSTFQGYIS
jgi:hypothetical protein